MGRSGDSLPFALASPMMDVLPGSTANTLVGHLRHGCFLCNGLFSRKWPPVRPCGLRTADPPADKG